MEEFFRKTVMAGMGFLDMTKEKVEDFIDDMIKRGELTQEERGRYVKETMDKVEQRSKEAKEWIQKQVEETVEQLKPKTGKLIEELQEKVDSLSRELQRLREELNQTKSHNGSSN